MEDLREGIDVAVILTPAHTVPGYWNPVGGKKFVGRSSNQEGLANTRRKVQNWKKRFSVSPGNGEFELWDRMGSG